MASRPAPRRPNPAAYIGWIGIILLFTSAGLILWLFNAPKSIDYSRLLNLIDKGKVERVVIIGKDRVEGELKEGEQKSDEAKAAGLERRSFQTEIVAEDLPELVKRMKEQGVDFSHRDDPMAWMTPLLVNGLPVLLVIGVFLLIILPRLRDPMGGAFASSYIKSPARRYEKGKTRTTFADVADMLNAKTELQEVVDFLKEPEKFARLGAQVPKGVLLVGPPGTGKTLLAKAAAGEADVPFFSINGSEFIQLFVGVGASRVRDLFKTAKESAPCIIFIDEIDAVGRMRGAGLGGGSDEREQTLNQILGEMDGFMPNDLIFVLAATNRPDVLDPALLRPGRFDRHITIDRPTWQGRLAILQVHTRNKPLADDVDLEAISRQLTGMTGADLRNLANEAALLATRENRSKVERRDFERAADRVLIGPKREEVLSEDEKRATAYHEAGHALVSWHLPEGIKPMKVSLIPRGQALGANIIVPDEDKYHHGKNYYMALLTTRMGGRAAERLVYGQAYSGAEDDLRRATQIGRFMVTHWGMSDRVGPMALRTGEEHVFLGKEIQQARDFSEGMAEIADQEIQKLLREADDTAHQILQTNRADLDRLAAELLKREEMSRAEIEELLQKK
jgi:cell division protease FtsH